jgi:hypothetical protein
MIYKQLWIDGLRQPNDIWTLSEGLVAICLKKPTTRLTGKVLTAYIIVYTYPTSEADYNFESWKTETGGNDSYSTKTWLEK